MSTYNLQNVAPVGFLSTADVLKFRCVESDGTPADAIADCTIGVSLTDTVSGDMITMQTTGIAKIVASAAITAGVEVMVTAGGAGKVSTLSGATARSVGVAMNAAGADGDIVEVMLNLPSVAGPPSA